MPTLHVCPLGHVQAEAVRLQPSGLITLLSPGNATPERPSHLRPDQHLTRLFNDISVTMDGLTPPSVDDVGAIIAFALAWDRRGPLLIHCFAGISRSTAAAYIVAATLHPELDADELAKELRRVAPTATPNILMIEHADDLLRRGGLMIEAIESIGMGELAAHGQPFALPIKALK
jgi:predicted protein tyrosine phosphatase